MSDTKRLVIITSGGDWYDAGFTTLHVGADFNHSQRRKEYLAYRAEYMARERARAPRDPYLIYTEWLLREGHATAADVETYDEHDYE